MGDEAERTSSSFDAMFVVAYPRLVRLAAFMVGDDAEDAVMDAFARVRPAAGRLENPHAYLRAAVVNECRTRWRRAVRIPRLVRTTTEEHQPSVDTIWRVVITLPSEQRAVVALRFYEDLTVPQIADVLDMPVGTVKSHLHRAIAALRTKVGDPDGN